MFKEKKQIFIPGVIFLLLGLALYLLPLQSAPQPLLAAEKDTGPTISVQGTGYAFATPDRARVILGVVTMNRTAQEAQKANAIALSKLVDDLVKRGILKKDIQTFNYNIWPQYNYKDQEKGNPPKITGYRVENMLAVTLKDLKQVGPVIDTAVENGINQVQNIEFFNEDDNRYQVEALKSAVKDAQTKAEAVANTLGKKITGIASVDIGGSSTPIYVYNRAKFKSGAAGAPTPIPTPIEPGEIKITANVTIIFKISN